MSESQERLAEAIEHAYKRIAAIDEWHEFVNWIADDVLKAMLHIAGEEALRTAAQEDAPDILCSKNEDGLFFETQEANVQEFIHKCGYCGQVNASWASTCGRCGLALNISAPLTTPSAAGGEKEG